MSIHTLIGDFYNQISGTIFNILIVLILYGIMYFTLVRKRDSKEKTKIHARILYVIILIFLILIIKTWFEGFTNLLAILSLISAGFIIVNKELVMNLIGWLIINWRSLFVEGDYIEINNCKGYVHDLRVLYFELFEVSHDSITRSSGRVIKIPNGFVTIYPIINYTVNTNFIEYSQQWPIPKHVDISSAKELISRIAKSTLATYYQNTKEYSVENLQRKNKLLAKLIDLDVHITYEVSTFEEYKDQPDKLTLYYYCYPKDYNNIHENLKILISKQLNELSELKLAKQNTINQEGT